VSHAGAALLLRTAEKTGLTRHLSEQLASWRKPATVHDPGKIVLDLAVMLAVGGDCASGLALLRTEPGVFGLVASDPTVSRTITALAADAPKVLAAIASARVHARARAWALAGNNAPDHGISNNHPLIIDLDASLTESHSEKENAAPTFKRGFGFHSLWSFIDHGPTGTGEPAAPMLRPGNAGSNTAADHKHVLHDALAQLPGQLSWRVGRHVLVRTDSAGGTHEFLDYCHRRRLQYSIGFTLTDDIVTAMDTHLHADDWTPAYDAQGEVRPGAWIVEVTGLTDLSGWPPGMRLVVRKERPHPGAQLRFTDHNGHRLTAFAHLPLSVGRHRSSQDSNRRTCPRRPSAINNATVRKSLSQSRFWNTDSGNPAWSAAALTCSASTTVTVKGLYTTTGSPAAIARKASGAWLRLGVAIATKSIPEGSVNNSSAVDGTRARGYSRFARSARSADEVTTAATRIRGAATIIGAWNTAPASPYPTMATPRRGTVHFPFRRWRTCARHTAPPVLSVAHKSSGIAATGGRSGSFCMARLGPRPRDTGPPDLRTGRGSFGCVGA